MNKFFHIEELEFWLRSNPGNVWWIHDSDHEGSDFRVKEVLGSKVTRLISVLFVHGAGSQQVERLVDLQVYVLGGLNLLAGAVCDEEEALLMAEVGLDADDCLLIY